MKTYAHAIHVSTKSCASAHYIFVTFDMCNVLQYCYIQVSRVQLQNVKIKDSCYYERFAINLELGAILMAFRKKILVLQFLEDYREIYIKSTFASVIK